MGCPCLHLGRANTTPASSFSSSSSEQLRAPDLSPLVREQPGTQCGGRMKAFTRPSLPAWPRRGCRGLKLAGPQPPAWQAGMPAYLARFPMETTLIPSHPCVCVRGSVPSPSSTSTHCPISPRFPEVRAPPVFVLSTRKRRGESHHRRSHGRQERLPPEPNPLLDTGEAPAESKLRESSQRCLCLVTQGLTAGEGAATEDPPPCPWRRSLS